MGKGLLLGMSVLSEGIGETLMYINFLGYPELGKHHILSLASQGLPTCLLANGQRVPTFALYAGTANQATAQGASCVPQQKSRCQLFACCAVVRGSSRHQHVCNIPYLHRSLGKASTSEKVLLLMGLQTPSKLLAGIVFPT